jgi:hypothetical protein
VSRTVFIELTHFNSGDRVLIRADTVTSIRAKADKTLVISMERGQYVTESADAVRLLVEGALNL